MNTINLITESYVTKKHYSVKEVDLNIVRDICKKEHYLKRVPSIVKYYGLYRGESLMGVITFGIPPSPYLMKMCGDDYSKSVLELNRLWCKDESPKNSESFLISNAIKLLKKERPDIKVLVSFADTREGHLGYIYQATNWKFTGFSIPGGGSILINGQEYHPKNLNNKYGTSDLNKLKDILNTQNVFYRPRSKKLRYVMFISGDKKENKYLESVCKYRPIDGYIKEIPKETEYKTKKQKLTDKMVDGI